MFLSRFWRGTFLVFYFGIVLAQLVANDWRLRPFKNAMGYKRPSLSNPRAARIVSTKFQETLLAELRARGG